MKSMNCTHCGTALVAHARFCPNCGTPVAAPTPAQAPSRTAEDSSQAVSSLSEMPTQQFDQPQPPALEPTHPVSSPRQSPLSPPDSPPPLLYYQANQVKTGARMPPATINTAPASRRVGRRRGCAGCSIGGCLTLVILVLILAAAWVFAIRPYLHNLAMTQLDHAMSSATEQIPPQAALLPPGPVVIREAAIQNLIVLNLAPSDPIKNPVAQITPSGVRLDFQSYALPNSISLVPATVNGQLTATHVTLSGPISLILSPDDLATLMNKHLADAQARLKHRIMSVNLQQHEMTLQLG